MPHSRKQFVSRWVVTYLDKKAMRTLVGPRHASSTFATRNEATQAKFALQAGKSDEELERLFNISLGPLAVRQCECHPTHFTPLNIWFD